MLWALHVWGVHVRIRIYGCWLEWRCRLVCPFVKTVLDRHVLGPLPTLPGDSFRWYLLGYRQDGPYVAGGPVGPYGTLSPSDSDPAGSDGPYVAGGPVGPDGTLSPFISDPAGPDGLYVAGGPVGPYGTLSPSDSDPAGSNCPYVAGGPVGPDGTLSPFISDPAGPYGTLSPHLTLTLLAPTARMLQGNVVPVYL